MSSQLFLSYEINNKPHFTELTCTSNVSVDFKNKVTAFPVEAGSYISDHVSNAPVEINFSGILSNISNYNLDYGESVEDTIKALKFLRETNTPFTVNVSDSLDSYSNCVFTNFVISQSSGAGTSWRAELNMTQIQVGDTSSLDTYPDNEIKDQHSGKNSQGDNGTEGNREATFLESIELVTAFFATTGGSSSLTAISNALSEFEFGEVTLTPRSDIRTR